MATERDANRDVDARVPLARRGRLLSAFVEIGADLDPAASQGRNPLIVRRLRLYDDGAEFPRDDPGGTTSLVVQLYGALIPAEDKAIDTVIDLGELAGYPQATVPALGMMHELAKSLVDNAYLPFAIEPAWARALGRMVADLSGELPPAGVVAAARRAQIARVVERFSGDQRLTPVSLADTIQISRRTLYELTAPTIGGISEYIRLTRARRAVAMLVDPACDSLTIGEIARRTGFSSTKHLRRAISSIQTGTPEGIRTSRQAAEVLLPT